ncbi:Unconventional myosin-Vb [Bonamia ostreae]|uniref:Unconventional myosin-Vb n=1 Tax=Bonamia ostreae TaxID=126728 RepID=A0ABV2AHI7_9EUKA
MCVFQIISAILHLGNVDFVGDSDDCCSVKDSSRKSLGHFCRLLRLDESEVMKILNTTFSFY